MLKFVIWCNYHLKANKLIKMQSFYDNDGGMNCQHVTVKFCFLTVIFYNFFSIWLTCNRTFYSFDFKKLNFDSFKNTLVQLIPYWVSANSTMHVAPKWRRKPWPDPLVSVSYCLGSDKEQHDVINDRRNHDYWDRVYTAV